MAINLAVVGATGAVGAEFLTVLAERNFPIKNLKLLASARSAGKTIEYKGEKMKVDELTKNSFAGVEIALFSAGGSISIEFAQAAVSAGAVVVDNSSAFRMTPGVPLVIPEVNPEAIKGHKGIIANPNCSTIIMNVPVWPLYQANKIKRLVISTYQAVSGAGAWGLWELEDQIRAYAAGEPITKNKFPHQIINNVFSHNSAVQENGYNEEENKMVNETRKIFGDMKIAVTATCVRVPVLRAHCESINIEFANPMTPALVKEILAKAPGVTIVDCPETSHFPMPLEASHQDNVFAGRIRQDVSLEGGYGIDMFVAGDQLRKGAATNAIQIAELLLK